MDEHARTGTLDSTHELWQAMHRSGNGRLSGYAMFMLGQMPGGTPSKRLVLLTMMHVAEIESFSGNGYNGTAPADLVLWTGLAESTIKSALSELCTDRLIGRRQWHDGAWRFYPPEVAMRWVNGEHRPS